MKKKATIILDGVVHEIMISPERAEQIRNLQRIILENRKMQVDRNKTSK